MQKNGCLNKIFYGSYFTGKTFNAILEALKIVGSNKVKDDKNYIYSVDEVIEIMNEFEEKKREGVIEFVSFHDSYSYNLFIEELDSSKSVAVLGGQNNTKKGIFKKIADEALYNCIEISEEKKEQLYKFTNLIESFKALFPAGSLMHTLNGSFQIMRYQFDTIGIKPTNGSSLIQLKLTVLKEMLKTLAVQGNVPSPQNQLNNICANSELRPLKDILEEYKDTSTYYYAIFQELKKFYDIIKEKITEEFYKGHYSLKKDGLKPYVMIIDEINHADISKVFGEVLPLLDEDTRGKLSTTLVYSQKRFMLPKNLHILATLNTYEAGEPTLYKNLRYFEFETAKPDKNMVADFGCGFSEIFVLLNKRLSVLLDKKYRIGHCYFLKSKYENADISVLKKIWLNKIIPLLLVYFDNDWDKLQILLGEAKNEGSFIKKEEPSGSLYTVSHLADDDCDFKRILESTFYDKK